MVILAFNCSAIQMANESFVRTPMSRQDKTGTSQVKAWNWLLEHALLLQ